MVTLIREENNMYEVDLGLLDLRNDVVFKTFFGNRRNNKLLLDFLNAILSDTIRSVELTDPHLGLNHSEDKLAVMDIRVLTDQNEEINVEIQLKNHGAFPERMLMYWAKMYAIQDLRGEGYAALKKAIQIVITDFELLPKPHFHSIFQLIDKLDGSIFSNHIEIHVLELPKLRGKQLQDTTVLEKWLLFLRGEKEVKEALAMESPTMKEAFEEIQRLSENPKTRALAISREINLRDQMQREYEARQEEREKIILRMHAKQTPAAVIADLTGIAVDKVEAIIESEAH